MFTLDNFLKPTMIKVNGVELEVFELVEKIQASPLSYVTDGLNMHFHGAIKFLLLLKQGTML